MRYSTQVKPISYIKANATEVLERLKETADSIIITQHGHAKAVLMDVRAFEQMEAERDRLIGLLVTPSEVRDPGDPAQ